MKKLSEFERKRLIREAHRLIDRVEGLLNHIADSIDAEKKKAA